MNVNAVGKVGIEAKRAYLAGLIDGDGCIMATIERHREMRFGFRVRVELKITQKEPELLHSLAREWKIGRVSGNRKNSSYVTYDWIIRKIDDLIDLLETIRPYSRSKSEQVAMALEILRKPIRSEHDLKDTAQLADSLSKLNVRSQGRRSNFASMI